MIIFVSNTLTLVASRQLQTIIIIHSVAISPFACYVYCPIFHGQLQVEWPEGNSDQLPYALELL